MPTTDCNHVQWLKLVEGHAGPHLLHGCRMSQIVENLPAEWEQFPQLTLLVGRKQKDIALRQFCKSRYRPSSQHQPAGINLWVDRDSVQFRHRYPRMFADWNPGHSRIPLVSSTPKVCHREEEIPINWPGSSPWNSYDLILARLLFLFCDVICIFADDVGGMEKTLSLLKTWTTIGSASTLPRKIRPRVIIITGEIDQESVTQAILEEGEFLANTDRDSASFLNSFGGIKLSIVSYALSGEARYLQANSDVLKELDNARRDRETSHLMFSATHLAGFFADALNHVATNMLDPFDFIQSSRAGNMPDGSLTPHLYSFLSQGVGLRLRNEILTSYIASSLLMDAYPPLMHGFCPRAVYRSLYEAPVYAALCEVYGVKSFAKMQCRAIEKCLVTNHAFMVASERTSSQLHRDNAGEEETRWKEIRLKFTCFWCLRRCFEHPLPCGHGICDQCAMTHGQPVEGAEYKFLIGECISCRTPACLKINIIPPTAGPRILSIDGGGTRVMVPLEILTMMQDFLGEKLPVKECLELFVGTSSGGITALDMGVCQRDPRDSKIAFVKLARQFFNKRQRCRPSLLRRAINAWLADGLYDAKELDSTMISHFGSSRRMLDTPSTSVSGWKAAVVCSTIEDGTPVLITNYNGEIPPREDRGYDYIKTGSEESPFVWEAARATSAAPLLFPSITIPGAGSYQDGGVRPQNNNPIRLGLSEARRLWPQTPHPDAVISLGTCSASIIGRSRISVSRNFIVDGWLSRGFRSINSSYDGEQAWRDFQDLFDDNDERKQRYIRLNIPYPSGVRLKMDDPDIMPVLSRSVRKQSPESLKIRETVLLLLFSSFFFELDSMPSFQSGLFHCSGTIRCRASARPVIDLLFSMHPERIHFYKRNMNLGLCLSQEDICRECRRYIRPVRFSVKELKDSVMLSLCFEGVQRPLSQFPNSMQWFIDRQGLNYSFGAANHGMPFRIQCDVCESRTRVMGKKRKYVDI